MSPEERIARIVAEVRGEPGREDKSDERDLRVLRKALGRRKAKRAGAPGSRRAPRRKRGD